MKAQALTILAYLIVPNFSNKVSRSFSLVPLEKPRMQICGFDSDINKLNYTLIIFSRQINNTLDCLMGYMTSKPAARRICIDDSEFGRIKDKLCLDDQNIQDLFECFRRFDSLNRSYFDLDDFIGHFRNEIQNFVELPYAQRLFKCIPKSQQSRIYFQEFIEGISAFCLLNQQSVLHFIFDFIDTDGDQRISKKDILRLVKYTDPKNGRQTFFTNFSGDLDQFPMKERQNKMDFDHFRMNSDKLLFLIWPAFSFQDYLRETIMGENFWASLYVKVEKKQIEIKNNEKKQQRMRQKLEILKSMKNREVQSLIFKDKINQRKHRQIADDSKLLRRHEKPRRKSTPYIKQQFQLMNMQIEDMEQYL